MTGSPAKHLCQIFCLFFFVILECHKHTSIPKRFFTLVSNCGVRLISGTIINICFFSFKNLSIISKYTSVLPEPVTPSNKTGLFDLLNDWVISLNEFACSSLKVTKEGSVLLKLSNFSLSNSTISLLIRNNFKTAPSGAKV